MNWTWILALAAPYILPHVIPWLMNNHGVTVQKDNMPVADSVLTQTLQRGVNGIMPLVMMAMMMSRGGDAKNMIPFMLMQMPGLVPQQAPAGMSLIDVIPDPPALPDMSGGATMPPWFAEFMARAEKKMEAWDAFIKAGKKQ
jgi:hypothetical protein